MRPLPAQRIGSAHGLLRALDQRGRLRLDEFVTEFSDHELFPPDSEPDTGRTRQYLSLLRALGLVHEERGTCELTDFGRRYVRAGDRSDVFAVAPGQAEWLRRALRERHMTDSVWHGAAIALSLCSTLRAGEWVAVTDFGRCAAHLGRVGWDNENTFRMQGERFTRLLHDMELIGDDRRLTAAGEHLKVEMRLPVHVSLADLAAQLHPGGRAGVEADARAERAALGLDRTSSEPAVARAAGAGAPGRVPEPAAPSGYETVMGSAVSVPPPVPSRGAGASAAEGPPAPDVAPVAGAVPAAEAPPALAAPDAATSAYAGAAPSGTAPSTRPAAASGPPQPPPAAMAPAAAMAPPPVAAPDDRTSAYAAAPAPPAPPEAAVAPAMAPPAPALGGAPPPAAAPAPFLDFEAVRRTAEGRGLSLKPGVYAAAIAALASGRHLVLTGGAGHGKTVLARVLAEVAERQGRSGGTAFAAVPGLAPRDLLGRRGPDGGGGGLVPSAVARGAWLVLDELDRGRPDRLLGRLSPLLDGQPLDLPGGTVAPPPDWRVIATVEDPGAVTAMSRALRRRFALVEVPAPSPEDLDALIDRWSGGDPVAAAVGRRLGAMAARVPVGPAVIRDAVAYVRHRRAIVPADERVLTREALSSFVLPQVRDLGEEAVAVAVAAAGVGPLGPTGRGT